MASTKVSDTSRVQYVEMDGLVALKIIKHCQEEGAGGTILVQGVLLGLVEKNKLEVTNCFPFPRPGEDETFDEVNYQMGMMRNLRHVNIDHLHVGWYQSTLFGSFMNRALLESQFNYQHSIDESIVLIYDALRTVRGHLSLKAFRLTKAMMSLYKEGDFTPDSIQQAGVSFENMFDEIPIKLKNSHLINVLLCELEEKLPTDNKYNFMDLATNSVLEKNLHLLMNCVDDLSQDVNKFFNYQRQVYKVQQNRQQYAQKRQLENSSRVSHGEAPLPEEDLSKLFRIPQPPARLESMLCAGQICSYVDQIENFATHSFGKLFMAEALHSDSK